MDSLHSYLGMSFRTLYTALPIVALSTVIATILLATSSPILNPAWHVTTSRSDLFVSDIFLFVWMTLAGLGVLGAVLARRRLLALLSLPSLLLALWSPQSLSLDTSLLSRQIALQSVTVEFLGGRKPLREAPPVFSENLLKELYAWVFFDTSGIDAFRGARVPDSDHDYKDEISRIEEELNEAFVMIGHLYSGLNNNETVRCLPGKFYNGGIKKIINGDYDCLLMNQINTRVNQSQITAKQQEIDAIKARLSSARNNQKLQREAHENLTQARKNAFVEADWQNDVASQTGVIAFVTFILGALTVLFTPWGRHILGLSLALTLFGLLVPSSVITTSETDFFFVVANSLSILVPLLALYALRLFALHNFELWRVLSPRERALVGLKVLVYWSAPAVLLAGGILGSRFIDDSAMDQFYRENSVVINGASECEPQARLLSTAQLLDGSCARRRLEADVERAIRFHFENMRVNAAKSLDRLTDEALSSADWARKTATQVIDDAIPDKLAETSCRHSTECSYISPAFNIQTGCDFWRIVCHLKNAGKRAAQVRYDRSRQATISTVEDKLLAAEENAKSSTEVLKREAGEAINQTVRNSIIALDRFAWSWFRANDVLRFVAVFCLILAVLKSVGYVLIRVIHFQDGFNDRLAATNSDLKWRISDQAEGKVTISKDSRLTVPAGNTFCIASSVAVQNHQSHLVLPMPSVSLFVGRAFAAIGNRKNANALYSVFRTTEDDEVFSISTDEGRRLVAVRLEEGESIAFDPTAFVGRNNTVRLKMRWGFRATDLMAGRIRRPHARGPGYVIFRTSGEVEVALPRVSRDNSHLIEVSRLVAWTPGAPYKLVSQPGFGAMYLGTTDVCPAVYGIAIGDGGRGARVAFGAVRSFLLLLPI